MLGDDYTLRLTLKMGAGTHILHERYLNASGNSELKDSAAQVFVFVRLNMTTTGDDGI